MKIIGHTMMLPIKTLTSFRNVLTYIITSITDTSDDICLDFHNCRFYICLSHLFHISTKFDFLV